MSKYQSIVAGKKMLFEALKRTQPPELEEVAEFLAEMALKQTDDGAKARRLSWLITSEDALTNRKAKYLWRDDKGEVTGTLLTEAQVIERAGKDHGFICLPWSKTTY